MSLSAVMFRATRCLVEGRALPSLPAVRVARPCARRHYSTPDRTGEMSDKIQVSAYDRMILRLTRTVDWNSAPQWSR